MLRSCSFASPSSTIARTLPSPSRTTRPYGSVRTGSKVSTVAAASLSRCASTNRWSKSGVNSGESPDSTRTSPSKPARAVRAAAMASPVPRASGWTATVTPTCAIVSSVCGEVTTTSGFAPSARAVSITQSTSRRPSSGWRCFGVSERMRVPRPAAMTTAASLRSFTGDGAGAPGFEPGIAGPKPAALPLGYAPPPYVCRPRTGSRRPHGPSPDSLQVGVASDALALGYAPPPYVCRSTTGSRRPHGPSPDGLQVGVASDALALGYAPPPYVCRPRTGSRRPHGPSPYGLRVGVASDALALGHAPTQCSLSRRREPRAHPRSLVARAEEQDQRHDREYADENPRESADDE